MCIILDVNCFNDFNDETNSNMRHARNWLEKENSKIVYSPTQKFEREWNSAEKKRKLVDWSRRGKLKQENAQRVESEASKLSGKIQSNDEHIIALAKIAGVKVLVSYDKDLHKDFTNNSLVKKGRVYQNATHKHLLKPDLCP